MSHPLNPDFSDDEYNKRMLQYTSAYRVKKGDDEIRYIAGKYARIEPWSATDPLLSCAICAFTSTRMKNNRMKIIKGLRLTEYAITQEGNTECVFTFQIDSKALSRLRAPLGLYVRRKYPNRKLAGAALQKKREAERKTK